MKGWEVWGMEFAKERLGRLERPVHTCRCSPVWCFYSLGLAVAQICAKALSAMG